MHVYLQVIIAGITRDFMSRGSSEPLSFLFSLFKGAKVTHTRYC